MSKSVRRTTTVAVAALLAAVASIAVAVLSSAEAQEPAARTLSFRELDKGATFTHIRNTRSASERSNSLGDVIAFTNPIVDASGKRIGEHHAQCVTTVGARDFGKSTITCTGVVHLRNGDLMTQFDVKMAADTTTGVITGGTGTYANDRGVVVSRHTATGSNDTITFAGPASP